MSQALYRKYRPTTFSEVVGQGHIKTTLLNELKNQQAAHAYLFCGPRGIGKTTLARLVAKGVNCLQPKEGEPCNECDNCKLVNESKALDLIEIDAASHTGVDNVRENVIAQARVAANTFKYKVFIIDEVHMLSISAFNALLKTLEEPPKNTIFILATTELHKLPATIISRCQRFDFKRIGFKDMLKKMEYIVKGEERGVDLAVLERIAQSSDGALRDAESMLSQVLSLNEQQITKEVAELVMPYSDFQLVVNFWKNLVSKDAAKALEQVNDLVEQGIDLQDFTGQTLEFLRKVLIYKINGRLEELEYLDISQEIHHEITGLLDKVSVSELQKMTEIIMEQLQKLKSAPIMQLPLELVVVEICYTGTSATPAPQEPKKTPDLKIPPKMKSRVPQKSEESTEPKVEGDVNKELFAKIEKNWDGFLKEVKKANHSLAMTMGVAHLVEMRGDDLVLGFKYKFHQDRLESIEVHQQVLNLLEKFYGQKILLKVLVSESYEDKVQKGENIEQPDEEEIANVWDLAVNSFGTE